MSIAPIHRQLVALAKPGRAEISRTFFKTGPGQYGKGDRFIGVTVPDLRRVSRAHRNLPRAQTTLLLKSLWHEERLLALLILVEQYRKGGGAEKEAIYRLYFKHTKYINSWDLVDSSAPYIVGPHLNNGDRSPLQRLARSPLIWERRIAILSTLHFIKQGDYHDTLAIAGALLNDSHDLIHKAVGWMLREVGNRDRMAEERFLQKHAPRMPRTMLRYAIERFPPRLRRRYLAVVSTWDQAGQNVRHGGPEDTKVARR